MDETLAVDFIRRNGMELEQAVLDYLLGDEEAKKMILAELENLQNEDGGFPYLGLRTEASCMSNTSMAFQLMLSVGLEGTEVFERMLSYILGNQMEDGGWDENEEILSYNPPPWDLPGDLKNRMWLTADLACALASAGMKDSYEVRKAADFLLSHRDEEGRFEGYLHSTWIAIGLFGQLEGPDSEIVQKGLKVVDENISEEWDASSFIWCLECFRSAGLPRENEVVERCIEGLVKLQQPGGEWVSRDGDHYTVTTTLGALKVLKSYGVIQLP